MHTHGDASALAMDLLTHSPSHRTQRVHTHGDASALAMDLLKITRWDFDQIVYTHGQSLCDENAKESFLTAWEAVLEKDAQLASAPPTAP